MCCSSLSAANHHPAFCLPSHSICSLNVHHRFPCSPGVLHHGDGNSDEWSPAGDKEVSAADNDTAEAEGERREAEEEISSAAEDVGEGEEEGIDIWETEEGDEFSDPADLGLDDPEGDEPIDNVDALLDSEADEEADLQGDEDLQEDADLFQEAAE